VLEFNNVLALNQFRLTSNVLTPLAVRVCKKTAHFSRTKAHDQPKLH